MANLGGKPLSEIPLPEGWAWYRVPRAGQQAGILYQPEFSETRVDPYKTKMRALKEWLEQYDLGAALHSNVYIVNRNHTFYITLYFKVSEDTGPKDFIETYFGTIVCPNCRTENVAQQFKCGGCLSPLACQSCASSHVTMKVDGTQAVCYRCYVMCVECKGWCDPNFTVCSACQPRARCRACRVHIMGDEIVHAEFHERGANNQILRTTEVTYCKLCSENLCGNCGNFTGGDGRAQYAEAIDANVCRPCFNAHFDIYRNTREDFDPDELPATKLLIPSMEGRELVRDVGVEIEGGGNGNMLASALFKEGLVPWDQRSDRHGIAGSHEYPAHIEYDASVDWEMVLAKFNPSKIDDMRRVNNILKIARKEVKAGNCHLDLRCGCHVHVDAHKYSMTGAFNLWALFAYMEDPIFRIGSAKWDVHRTVKYGRDNGAAQPVPKGPYRDVMEFGNGLRNGAADRYFALSFANFWNAVMGRCVCGAIAYGLWENCTCNLGKCTFEFRVFNSTLNPRKLHAYIALSQALVAKAATMEQIDTNKYAPMEWDVRPFKQMTEGEKQEKTQLWTERLTFMFQELPLTNDEKESLHYCVRNSSMAELLSDEFIAGLHVEPRITVAV